MGPRDGDALAHATARPVCREVARRAKLIQINSRPTGAT